MHVVVVVERVQKISDFFAAGVVEFDEVLGQVTDFRSDHVQPAAFNALETPSRSLISVRKRAPFWPAGTSSASNGFNLLGARLDGVAFRVAIGVRMCGFDNSEMVEKKSNAAGLAQVNRL